MNSLIRRAALAVALTSALIAAPALADELKPVSRIEPEFPREAIQAGVDKGMVRARMTIDGGGEVSRVEILEANPRRVFERSVVRALSQWRFSAGAGGRAAEVQLNFNR